MKAARLANHPQFTSNPFRPRIANPPAIDPDLDPRPPRPPSAPFDSAAEIKTIGDRLRWLCAMDNDAPRLMREHIDALAHAHDLATELSEEVETAGMDAAKKLEAAEEKVKNLESHIGKLITLIEDLSDALTPDEQAEPENVREFMEGYTRRLAAWEEYLTQHNLRQ